MKIPGQVLSLIEAQSRQAIPPGIGALADAARRLHGDAVSAVLFYGSCLRSGNAGDGLVDLYLLVDDYHAAFGSRPLAFFNKLLPPNVFYLELPYQERLLRAKYAVLTLDDFRKGTECWFHSYLWGRFAQQSGLIHVRDEQVAGEVQKALAAAVLTFVARTLPQLESPFAARDLWATGLALSYRSELRTEQPAGAGRLFDSAPEYYQALTAAALAALPLAVKPCTEAEAGPARYRVQISPRLRRWNRWGWRARAWQGKILSVLRLLKGLATFKGGVDYILWKIERHSGVRIEVGPRLKRLPPVAICVIFWRLYRRGAFR